MLDSIRWRFARGQASATQACGRGSASFREPSISKACPAKVRPFVPQYRLEENRHESAAHTIQLKKTACSPLLATIFSISFFI